MSTAAHTPGPWLDAGQLGHARLLLGADHTNIACFYSRDINPRAPADFTVAKAAPEMLAALKDVESKIVDYEAGHINWRPDDFLVRVRAAIAAAEPA